MTEELDRTAPKGMARRTTIRTRGHTIQQLCKCRSGVAGQGVGPPPILPASRQRHREGRAVLHVRRDMDLPAMGVHDFARDEQADTEAGVLGLVAADAGRDADEGIEHGRHLVGRDRRALVIDGKDDIVVSGGQADPDRGILVAVLDGIADEVGQHLRDAAVVEHGIQQGRHVQFDPPLRMEGARFIDHLSAHQHHAALPDADRHARPQVGTGEVDQVVDQLAHAFGAAEHPCRHEDVLRRDIGCLHDETRPADQRAQRIAQVMAEDRQEHVLRSLDQLLIPRHRLGQGLVDRLVEAHHVAHVRGEAPGRRVPPQRQHARAQGAVLGHQLHDGIAGQQAGLGMRFGGRFLAVAPVLSPGFGHALLVGLAAAEIVRESEQHQARVVAQRFIIHCQGRRFDGARKIFPFLQDRVHIVAYKIGKPGLLHCHKEPCITRFRDIRFEGVSDNNSAIPHPMDNSTKPAFRK